MGAHVLIAGCGDLGSRVAHLLAAQGDIERVTCLRRSLPESTGTGTSTRAAIHWVRADLTLSDTLDGLPQGITHLLYTPTPGARDADAYRAVFLAGLENVLQHPALQAVQRVVFVSSSAVYGEHHGDWIDHTTPTAPLGFNGDILVQAESRARVLAPDTAQVTALRLAGLYGPGRTRLLTQIKQGQARAPIDPPHWSNRIHIDDAARACVTLLTTPSIGPVYLGCDDTPLPQYELYAALAQRMDAPEVADGPPPATVGSKRMRNDALRQLGWTPRHPDARTGYWASTSATDALASGAGDAAGLRK